MVVSPDHGGVVRARSLAKRLECDLAIIDKRRPKANVSEVMNIIGEVEGRTCIIMDDMVDTAGTLCKAATALKANGAKQGRRLLYPPGAVRPGDRAREYLRPRRPGRHRHHSAARRCRCLPRIRQLSVAEIMAETIRRISNDDSVSSLFID
jgi:ribose-phosphate pyrophosphokinase